jgi:Zn-finger nucleic acid-binding protein
MCPVCSVAMQATTTDDKIVHLCQQCGLTITVVAPPKKDA